MTGWNHWRIRTKLGAAFGFAGLVILLLAALGLYEIQKVHRGMVELSTHDLVKLEVLRDLDDSVTEIGIAVRNSVLAPPGPALEAERLIVNAQSARFVDVFTMLREGAVSDDMKPLLAAVGKEREAHEQLVAQVVSMRSSGQEELEQMAREVVFEKLRPVETAMLAATGEVATLQKAIAAERVEAAARAARQATIETVIATVIGLAGLAAFGLFLTRGLTNSLQRAVDVAESVAAGDLTRPITGAGGDEVGQLLRALERMQQALGSVVQDVRQGVDSVVSASSQIAHGNADLSQRTEETASQLQQAASSMEQMSSSVKTNADNARVADERSATASDVARRGGEAVARVTHTMQDIQASARRIAEIIGTIDGIAFQTNILALNAAVEAARAGEQGRGFAVVAGEVRALAQRSGQAAKEIRDLIQSSVEKVDNGTALVNDARATMDDLVAEVQRVTHLIGEISSASAEQSVGVDRMSRVVVELDSATQQNAALVEQSAAAAESLKTMAGRLAQSVSVFRVGA
jgi:methyl-accepting chemotaxis protein